MSKIAALFGGQGSQYSGMGRELFEKFAYVRDIYDCGGDILGYNLAELSFGGSEKELALTRFSQPAIFALSVSAFTAAVSELGFSPDCAAGHSLGEYAALCCAGAFSVEDGFRIIKARAEAMSDPGGGGEGAMYAVMGLGEDDVRLACETKTPGFVEPVNFNRPGQTVISGEAKAAAGAAENLARMGAKVVRLNVSGAFHTKLMRDAAKRFGAEISGIRFFPASLPFYSNLTGDKLDIVDYQDYFCRHMTSPVLFSTEMQSMSRDGVGTCVEFGPKRALASLAKKNVKSMKVYGVEDFPSLEKLRETLEPKS